VQLSKSSQAHVIRRNNVLILENILYNKEQIQFSKQKRGEVLLTNARKSKEKSKNSASRRHWWSV